MAILSDSAGRIAKLQDGTLPFTAIDVNGGAIDATPIGGTTPAAGAFTTLSSSGAATLNSASITTTLGVTGASTLAAMTATTGSFSSTLGVTGVLTASNDSNAIRIGTACNMTTPPAIGGATPAAGAFTTLSSSGLSTLNSVSVTTTLGVTGAATLSSTLAVTGALSANTIGVLSGTTATVYNATATTVNAFGAATAITMGAGNGTMTLGSGSSQYQFKISGGAGSVRDFQFLTGVQPRWAYRCSNDAESGSNAGSTFQILARADDGSAIDTPLAITRAAGGPITLARPVSMLSTLTVAGDSTLGDASTDVITCTGRLLVRSVNDAGPMTATAGTQREIVFNTSDSKFYGCTVTGSPATWSALN